MGKYLCICIFFASCTSNFNLKDGDFLFQDLDSSELCEAIEAVTNGYKGSNLSHVGLVTKQNNEVLVIEAIPPEIVLTPLDTFLNRSKDCNGNPKVIVGRLKNEFKSNIEASINYCLKRIGNKYDFEFIFNNNSMYCSELIYNSFNNEQIFKAQPMIFEDPNNEKITKIWQEYYLSINKPIPHNKLGVNPGLMSISNAIEIVHIYGHPSGYEPKN
ncbi:MAG: hypothetical protein CMP70_03265 [Flavobacteriales bacterium]|nr:hypothetical protein [Flavobacteriales bacterium]